MKKLMLILLGVLMTFPMMARDFEYTYEGQTLTYTVISEDDKTCMTKEGTDFRPGNPVSGNLVIPAVAIDGDKEYSVTRIGYRSFNYCGTPSNNVLTSVTIPGSVTEIGYAAFEDCNELTSVLIPTSVTKIFPYAFFCCSKLSSVTFPGCVTMIGDHAFKGCDGLTSITIPRTLTEIGKYAFKHCKGLKEILVEDGNPNYSSIDGVMFNKDQWKLIQFPAGRGGEYEIPSSVRIIEYSAFFGSSSLTSIVIPNSVRYIEDQAFRYCSSLTSVTIPNSVTSIELGAFGDCTSLTSISIPNSVNYIGGAAFSGCSSLTSISIPNSVNAIDNSTFSDCSSLSSITIPNTVNYIGGGAFIRCSSLTSITIPKSVNHIEDWAFGGCSSLTSVYYGSKDPIEASKRVFDNEVYKKAVLYVPMEAVDKCKLIDPWKNFISIEAYEFSGIEGVVYDDLPCEVYTTGGVKVGDSTDGLAPGIYIVRQGNAVKKIAVN